MTVWVDDLRADVRHVGAPAHTTNDSIVWLPDRKVLYCGDLLFNGGTPFLVQGSVAGAIEVLEEVVKPLGATTIVPGTEPWPDRSSSTTSWGTCASFRPVPAPAATRGSHRWTPPANWTWDSTPGLPDPERIVGNLHRAYAELDGEPLGARIDVAAALTDMVTYNGGRPLSCLA